MLGFHRKQKKVATNLPPTPSSSDLDGKLADAMANAREAQWRDPGKVTPQRLQAIRKTWGVDCTIVELDERHVEALEAAFPLDSDFTERQGDDDPQSPAWYVKTSSNSIFLSQTHGEVVSATGGAGDYLKFLYHGEIFYVSVGLLVPLSRSLYDRMDTVSHLAKIMITLGEPMRRNFVVCVDGELVQDEGE